MKHNRQAEGTQAGDGCRAEKPSRFAPRAAASKGNRDPRGLRHPPERRRQNGDKWPSKRVMQERCCMTLRHVHHGMASTVGRPFHCPDACRRCCRERRTTVTSQDYTGEFCWKLESFAASRGL